MNTWRTTNTEALSSCFVYKSSGFVKFGEFLKSKEIVSSLERDFATSQSCTSSCTLSIWRRTLGPLPLTGTAVIFIFSIMMPLSYILPPSQVTSGYDTFPVRGGVAVEDCLPVEDVPSDSSETILARMPCAQEIFAERTSRTPRIQEIPQTDPIEKERATWLVDFRFFLRNGVEVLSSLN